MDKNILEKSPKKLNMAMDIIFQKYTIILVWIAFIVFFTISIPDIFPTWANFSMILGSKAVLVVLTLAIMVPMIGGDFDMSAASTLNISAMIIAILNVNVGLPIGAAIFIAMVVSVGIGVLNGALISLLNLNPFVVTMGVGTLLNGLTLGISRSKTITGLDKSLQEAVISGKIFGISYVFYYMLMLAIILFYIFEYTSIGRKVLIVGRGRNVARLSGIEVEKVRWGCFITSALIAGFGGVLYSGTMGSADPASGLSMMMPAFAGVFLGSTCIKPGRFNPLGCVVAVFFLVTGTTGLSLMGIQTFVQDIFYGLALILAVMSSYFVKKSQENRELKMANYSEQSKKLKTIVEAS